MAFLADFAVAHPDGKLYVIGGGLDFLTPSHFPYIHSSLSLAAKIEFPLSELGRTRTIEVIPMDADGRAFGQAMSMQVKPERNETYPHLPVSLNMVINMQGLQFQGPGDRSFAILGDGNELTAVVLHVLPAPGSTTERA